MNNCKTSLRKRTISEAWKKEKEGRRSMRERQIAREKGKRVRSAYSCSRLCVMLFVARLGELFNSVCWKSIWFFIALTPTYPHTRLLCLHPFPQLGREFKICSRSPQSFLGSVCTIHWNLCAGVFSNLFPLEGTPLRCIKEINWQCLCGDRVLICLCLPPLITIFISGCWIIRRKRSVALIKSLLMKLKRKCNTVLHQTHFHIPLLSSWQHDHLLIRLPHSRDVNQYNLIFN